jgi:hypothetical protein
MLPDAPMTTVPEHQPAVTPELIDVLLYRRINDILQAIEQQFDMTPGDALKVSPGEENRLTVQMKGATWEVDDPVLVFLLELKAECKRRPLPAPAAVSTSGTSSPVLPVAWCPPVWKKPNPRASINISAGQMRRMAAKRGEWTPGEPVPDKVVAQTIAANSLTLPDGTVPESIQRKLEQAEQLTEADIAPLKRAYSLR